MAENIHQIFVANPITSNTSTDLIYFGQSPYGVTNDAAMTYANFAAQFPGLTGAGASGTWGISISGNAATATSATSAGSATNATNSANVATTQVTANASYYPLMVASSTNENQVCDLVTGFTFNPNTGILTATGFAGALTGNVTGNVSGSSGSCTGNAATASAVAVGGITGLGTGVATSLADNITGSGSLVGTTTPNISQPNIIGVTTNSNAAAGSVGEFISSTISAGNAVTATSNAASDVTSIILTAGDWDVWGNISFPTLGTTPTAVYGWTNTQATTIPDESVYNGFVLTIGDLAGTIGFSVPQLRYSVSTTTTVYLEAYLSNTSGNGTVCGGIYARRAR